MKSIIIALCLFLSSPLYCNNSIPKFEVISIAKSGTYLIFKTIYLLSIYSEPPLQLGYTFAHFPLSNYALQNSSKKSSILMIRDPRDIIVSMVYHIIKHGWPLLENSTLEKFLALSFDDQLMYLIENDLPQHPLSEALFQASETARQSDSLPAKLENPIEEEELLDPRLEKFKKTAAFLNTPLSPDALNMISRELYGVESTPQESHSLLVRFENLVGEKGGGSLNSQLEELKKIATFLNIPLSQDALSVIAHELYGIQSLKNTALAATFREGKIGAWRNTFKEEHKEKFKKRFNERLIALGYEKNDQW